MYLITKVVRIIFTCPYAQHPREVRVLDADVCREHTTLAPHPMKTADAGAVGDTYTNYKTFLRQRSYFGHQQST